MRSAPFPAKGRTRRGVSMVLTLTVLLVIGLTGASLVRATWLQIRQSEYERNRAQAEWLAASALSRAEARLAASADWRGEIWELSADESIRFRGGVVELRIETDAETAERRIVAAARSPADGPMSMRASRVWRIPSNDGVGAAAPASALNVLNAGPNP